MPQEKHSDTPSPSPRSSLSMHEDVEIWCDCCSCEAEPRWQTIEDEEMSKATEERIAAESAPPQE